MTKSFITTPIFYVNAVPHIGHLYTAVLADAAHRWKCMVGGASGCVLSTGTDEHGIKIQQAAAKRGCTPQAHCDEISPKFEKLFRKANISYTHFIRTTSNQHKSLVQDIWSKLWDRGWIYKDSYEGWYSVPDECFLSSKQVKQVSNGPSTDSDKVSTETVSIETGHRVEWSSEVNYMFKLSAFKEQLLEWIDSTPYPIYPEIYRQLVLQWVREGLTDLSVSRPTSRLNWGVAVPSDQSQKIYVWLDALVNYLTVSGYPNPSHCWPASAHIVGKDILRFHAIYWPAFLLAAGLELPKRIIGHAHWTIDKHKMSKSIGNVVDPLNSLNKFGIDPLRYFLLKESSLQQDGDYSNERVAVTLNSDLADTLGNLLQRVTSSKLHPPGIKGQPDPIGQRRRDWNEEDCDLIYSIDRLPNVVGEFYDNYEFGLAINHIMETLRKTNRFINNHKPWLLVSDPDKHCYLRDVLALSINGLKTCTYYLQPVMPESCEEILARLGGAPIALGGRGHPIAIGGEPVFRKIKKY